MQQQSTWSHDVDYLIFHRGLMHALRRYVQKLFLVANCCGKFAFPSCPSLAGCSLCIRLVVCSYFWNKTDPLPCLHVN